MSKEECEILNLSYLKEYQATRNNYYLGKLYTLNRGLFYRICNRYTAYNELNDLLQECYFALVLAVEKYQEEEGSFYNYLAAVTRSYLYRFSIASNIAKYPEYLQKQIKRYFEFLEAYEEAKGQRPTDKQIIIALGITPEALQNIYKAVNFKNIKSFSEPINEETLLEDILPEDFNLEETCLEELHKEEIKERVWECIRKLSEEDQELIKKRFIDELTYKEINPNVSTVRTRQKVNKAFIRLQRNAEALKPLYDEIIENKAVNRSLNSVARFRRTWESSTETIIFQQEGLY